ncbi:unnamed protein product [marine sediment metagenome]|uniref:LIM zinc-binding domain-containing protein n=1 Tax=marine sediment metagenome TaxID=412755 RepID=X1TEZ0_9ZZZZ
MVLIASGWEKCVICGKKMTIVDDVVKVKNGLAHRRCKKCAS